MTIRLSARNTVLILAASLLSSLAAGVASGGNDSGEGFAAGANPAAEAITAAIADSARPSTDTVRDANRKPAQVLVFAGVKPGDKAADYAAGQGYFTRLFSRIVGPEG